MLNGTVRPGDVVAVVGAGPIGLSAILGSKLFSPSHVIAIDKADEQRRLAHNRVQLLDNLEVLGNEARFEN